MLRIKVNFCTYYVGSGKDLLRLWKRALKHGYENGYAGYEDTIPKYNPAGTYCIYFLSRRKKMYWNNFNTITAVGHYDGKDIPDYRQYKGNMKLAKCIYEMNKRFERFTMEKRLEKEIAKALENTAKAWIGACVTNMNEYSQHHKKAMKDFMDYYRVLKPLLTIRDGWITSDDVHNEIEKYLHNNNEQELWDYWKNYYAN